MKTTTAEARSADALVSRSILGVRVDATSYADASRRILQWAKNDQSRYVCVAAVNNVMEAHENPEFLEVMNRADLVTPDGMPLVWALHWLGIPDAVRVYGPELTATLLTLAGSEDVSVGFYGGTAEVLAALAGSVRRRWPQTRLVYSFSPPFRDLDHAEDARVVEEINSSGARILFVGLGCPKQEIWMARHVTSVRAVMVGIGAAFDFLSGTKKQAPPIIQRMGLEWLFRLAIEPRRLWRRYLRQNPRFTALLCRQLIHLRLGRGQLLEAGRNGSRERKVMR